MKAHKVSGFLRWSLLAIALVAGYQSFAIQAKAQFAQYLIDDAWSESLKTQQYQKPWSWADTWPVAKIEFSEHQHSLLILEGIRGNSLAFGPGHAKSSKAFTEKGTKIIAGHRDTHFNFLEKIIIGDQFKLQNISGQWQKYQVVETRIVDSRKGEWQYDENQPQIHIISCYPFDALVSGGPYRYVVIAKVI